MQHSKYFIFTSFFIKKQKKGNKKRKEEKEGKYIIDNKLLMLIKPNIVLISIATSMFTIISMYVQCWKRSYHYCMHFYYRTYKTKNAIINRRIYIFYVYDFTVQNQINVKTLDSFFSLV